MAQEYSRRELIADNKASDLHSAASNGQLDVVRQLLTGDGALKGDLVNCRDDEGNTPLLSAALYGHCDVVKYLVEEQGADLVCKNEDDSTALHYVTLWKEGNLDVVKLLVGKGAVINSQDNKKMTPIHNAAKYSSLEVVKYLVEHPSVDVNIIKDVSKDSPGYAAARNGQFEVANFLVQHGAKQERAIDATLERLEAAIRRNELEKFRSCVAYIDHFGQQAYKYAAISKESTSRNEALRYAAANGSSEMVEALIKLKVVVDRQGEKKRTPLHLACYNGHTETARCLLGGGANPRLMDKYGRNCLHLAIRANHKETAKLLLADKRWEEMMEKCDDSELKTPLLNLIVKMPGVAEVALNRCVKTNEGIVEGTVKVINPTSEDYKVTYNYKLLEGGCQELSPSDGSSSGNYQQATSKKRHPLYSIMKYNRSNLLKHPLVTSLVNEKWRSFGRMLFFADFFFYLIFLTFLTLFGLGLTALRTSEQACKIAVNRLFSGTRQEGCEGLSLVEYGFIYFAGAVTILLAIVRLEAEVYKMRHPLEYLQYWVKWMEVSVYFCAIIFVGAFATPYVCVYQWWWQFGVVAIFLGWIVLIAGFQRWPYFGIYVLMLVHIIEGFLKVAFLALLLVVVFALAFYMQFFDPHAGEMQNAFSSPGRAFMKVLAMTTGDLDYNTIFHQEDNEPQRPLTLISCLLWVIFLVVMPTLLVNFLTGLAVGDVKEVKLTAKESKIKIQIDLVLAIEETLRTLHCCHWFRDIPNLHSICINDRKALLPEWFHGIKLPLLPKRCNPLPVPEYITKCYLDWFVCDPFFRTGEEIATAIKPQVPIEEQMSDLREQRDELKQLASKTEGEIKQLAYKTESEIKQLASKTEGDIKQLASKTEREIKQLAGEVASMREAVDQLVKKLS